MDTTLFSAIGIMEEPTPYIAFDEMFSMEVGKHKKDVKLSQSLTISKDALIGKHLV